MIFKETNFYYFLETDSFYTIGWFIFSPIVMVLNKVSESGIVMKTQTFSLATIKSLIRSSRNCLALWEIEILAKATYFKLNHWQTNASY